MKSEKDKKTAVKSTIDIKQNRDKEFHNITSDVLIVGAGASGLFAASQLSHCGLKVQIVEYGPAPGKKLSISGGGHANFTNRHMVEGKFLAPPGKRFCTAALKAWTPEKICAYMRYLGFSIVEKAHGRLFLWERASDLVSKLCLECKKTGCEIHCKEKIIKASFHTDQFQLVTENLALEAPVLILATGSPAHYNPAGPNAGLELARKFGHNIQIIRPALVPLLYNEPHEEMRSLSGIGVPVSLCLKNSSLLSQDKVWNDDLLFTHKGLSGPVILSASLYYTDNAMLEINFLPEQNFAELLAKDGKRTARSVLRGLLPQRLADFLLQSLPASRKIAELSRNTRELMVRNVNAFKIGNLKPGALGCAEVCSGGVSLENICPVSMESKIISHLYICGEMQNVTGELGGYNIHWAFASAFLAVQHILGKLNKKPPAGGFI